MTTHRFDKGNINPDLLMDRCIAEIPGFRSGGYHEGVGTYLADDIHGRISWDADTIWVSTIDSISRVTIQTLISTL